MANRTKNNFSDKLKRLGCSQLQKQNKNKSKKQLKQTFGGLIREKDEFLQQRISIQMLDEMRKQIDLLSNKLIEAEREREKRDNEIELLSLKIGQKNIQSNYLSQQLAESHRSIEMIKKKWQLAQSELQNIRLRQKMESISTEISKDKPINSPLKHQKHRKGKFSQAILPAAFGSQKKFEFHNSELLVKDEIIQEEIRNSQNFLRSPFSGYLIEQWQRTQNQRNCKQLQVANLQSKITSLKKEIAKQQKQIDSLKVDKPSGHELAGALQEIRQQNRRYKLVLMKLRESEKKRKDLSNILKLKGETVEQDKFYGFSTIADINEMIQKSAQNLQIEHSVFEIFIEPNPKKEKQIQTSQQNEKDQINQQSAVIQQLRAKISNNEQQLRLVCQQIKQHYQCIIQQYASQIQHHQAKLQHFSSIISKYQSQKQTNQHFMQSVSSQCSIINYHQFQQQTNLASQMHQLTVKNQQYQQRNQALLEQNAKLTKAIFNLSKGKDMSDKIIQVNDNIFDDNKDETGCSLCVQLKYKYFHMKQQIGRLSKIIDTITDQRNHFKHYYEQSLTSYHQLQLQMQTQINKIKAQIQEKQQSLRNIATELLEKTHQVEHYKLQAKQLQLRLHQQQQLRNKFENNTSVHH